MGDAAHTAHFSVGSGTKLALEDAIALARALRRRSTDDLRRALRGLRGASARVEVLKLQNAARNSIEWFENVERYTALEAEQFAYSPADAQPAHLAREPAPARRALRRAASSVVRGAALGGDPRRASAGAADVHAVHAARRRRSRTASSSRRWRSTRASTACPTTIYLVHLGSRAHRRRGARVHRNDVRVAGRAHHARLRRHVRTMSSATRGSASSTSCTRDTHAKIALQLGHAGPKGSTQLGWEGADEPLPDGQLAADRAVGASRIGRGNAGAARDDARRHGARARRVRRAPTRGGRRAASTGSSSTARTAICCRLHLAAHQPARRRIRRLARESLPLSARGVRGDARASGRRTGRCPCASRRTTGPTAATRPTTRSRSRGCSRHAGADLIDVSSGQTTREAQPVYGRMYQTPFADRIRNEVGIATMAVGAIFEPDHVNSIIAGRARRSVRARAAASRRSVLDAARGRAARLRAMSTGRSSICTARRSSSAIWRVPPRWRTSGRRLTDERGRR